MLRPIQPRGRSPYHDWINEWGHPHVDHTKQSKYFRNTNTQGFYSFAYFSFYFTNISLPTFTKIVSNTVKIKSKVGFFSQINLIWFPLSVNSNSCPPMPPTPVPHTPNFQAHTKQTVLWWCLQIISQIWAPPFISATTTRFNKALSLQNYFNGLFLMFLVFCFLSPSPFPSISLNLFPSEQSVRFLKVRHTMLPPLLPLPLRRKSKFLIKHNTVFGNLLHDALSTGNPRVEAKLSPAEGLCASCSFCCESSSLKIFAQPAPLVTSGLGLKSTT